MNNLESLDICQGNDPELLAIRETIPEPSWTDNPMRVCLIPPRQPWLFEWTKDGLKPDISRMERTEFRKVRMSINGTIFTAWQSDRDGKVYL